MAGGRRSWRGGPEQLPIARRRSITILPSSARSYNVYPLHVSFPLEWGRQTFVDCVSEALAIFKIDRTCSFHFYFDEQELFSDAFYPAGPTRDSVCPRISCSRPALALRMSTPRTRQPVLPQRLKSQPSNSQGAAGCRNLLNPTHTTTLPSTALAPSNQFSSLH